MPAEISTVNVNGVSIVEAMYANRPAWHGLGTIFDADGQSAPDSAEAMRLAHLGWGVEKRQLYLPAGDDPGSVMREARGCFATVRTDTGEVLGAVGERYHVLQNAEAFSFLDSLQMDGVIHYESAFALRGGRQVALLARLPSVDLFGEGDHGLRYIMLRTSHDGSTEIDIVPTSVRVVCANTVRAAIDGAAGRRLQIRHTANMADRLAQARRYLALLDAQFTGYAEIARRLASSPYSRDNAAQYIAELFPLPTNASMRQKRTHGRKIEAIRAALRHPSNSLLSMQGTVWQLFNAVTFALDHAKEFNRFKGAERVRAESRFLSAVEGRNSELKSRAFSLALSMVG